MSKGWDESAARDVMARNAPSQPTLPLGRPHAAGKTGSDYSERYSEWPQPAQPSDLGPQTSGQKDKTGLQPDAEGWVELVIPGPPFGKERPQSMALPAKAAGQRSKLLVYTPKETVEREAAIKALWSASGGPYFGNALLEMEVLLFMTPYKNGNRRKLDWDNGGKLCADALNKTAYEDDNAIIDARVRKFVDAHSPRTVIRLRKAVE